MPPANRVLPRYAAEPPQDSTPYGRFADRLRAEFLAACQGLVAETGEPGEVSFYPDRTWHGRTYIPATAPTAGGMELFGYVRFVAGESDEPSELGAQADFTEETAERNPDWQLDLCDEVVGRWRGDGGKIAAMTLVWGRSLVPGGVVAVAELGNLSVDQCTLDADRFTLLAPDDYGGDLLEVRLFAGRGEELARESLYD
ncbi:MAG: hypothetical protein NVSMB51_18840 [Solirubrobacteraceae bacterium]